MTPRAYLLVVLGMGLVTYLSRWLPLVILSRRELPKAVRDWLDLVPIALLAALIAPHLLASTEPRVLDLGRPELLAALPTLVFAVRTRSLAGTVLVGMLLYWLADKVL